MISKILNERELCDLELLLDGGFSPLDGFLKEADYAHVLENMKLSNSRLWPIPVCLPISKKEKTALKGEKKMILKDETGMPIAYLYNEEIYEYSPEKECEKVFGCFDLNHPYQKIIKQNYNRGNQFYIGGRVEKIRDVIHYDFNALRHSPAALKKILAEKAKSNIVAFQTRNPMHKSHFYLTLNALKEVGDDALLLLHPVVGVTQEVDLNYHLRVICYRKLLHYYPKNTVVLSLLPLSMRMAGPREALWHALIRKNYGATHFIVGRDHAGPSYKKENGENFYEPYEAQDMLEKYQDEIGISMIKSKMISYVKERNAYLPVDKIEEGHTVLNLSGTAQRERLHNGEDLPPWFSFEEIVSELKKSIKPKNQRGCCIYFVGIPASGKSTFANFLITRLKERITNRNITLLDGDVIRMNLSKGLGFSVEDRKENIERIGFVASEIVKHHGICVVANIAPFEASRKKNRDRIESNHGTYIEVFVKTDLATCIQRDPKGLYAKAKKGEIKNLTGFNDTFEIPQNPEVVIDGTAGNINTELDKIIEELEKRKLI